jgi:5,10-methenyltetrahydrofolate synthetase
LRERIHQVRDGFVATSGVEAHAALSQRLSEVLSELQPERLGLYWPLRSEFNAALACVGDMALQDVSFALPRARKSPRELQYRTWDRREPQSRDDLGIPCADGVPVLPDVILVPCLGYTADGYRLGYGGGYYDRWLAAHPHVTAVGVAWSVTQLTPAELAAEPHDQPLMLVVTERGVVGG